MTFQYYDASLKAPPPPIGDGIPHGQRWKWSETHTLLKSVRQARYECDNDNEFWESFRDLAVGDGLERDLAECDRYYRHYWTQFRRESFLFCSAGA